MGQRAFVQTVRETGRKMLIIAGVWTSVCVAFPALDALADGYSVYAVMDASGDPSEFASRVTPDPRPVMEEELKAVIRHLAENRWPFRLHATYDETITRALNVYEEVNREVPLEGLHWFFDHCETISDRNVERVRRLGGGIAVQSRMAFQGEHFVERYGREQALRTPPVRRMLEMGVPVGAGTDATRVSSYNPWVALYWLVTGNTVGGLNLYPEGNRLGRAEALRLYTVGSSWFSSEEGKKGAVAPGQLADLAVLSADYFSVPRSLASLVAFLFGALAGGDNPRLGRRVASVMLMFGGALLGALLLRHGLALPLVVSGVCVLVATAAYAARERPAVAAQRPDREIR